MRLNNNTYPAYITLEKKQYLSLTIDAMFGDDMLTTSASLMGFIDAIKVTHEKVENIYYLTNTFKEAIITASPKITGDLKHHKDITKDCGIIFTDKGFTLYITNPSEQIKLICYGFTRNTLTTYGHIDKDFNYFGLACTLKDGKPYNNKIELFQYLDSVLLAVYFIHNCEIETKIINPKEKYRQEGNKYFNESNSKIKILDCKWFTDLIRNIPYRVKGHLRWQVHGEKKSKRKLIWIEEYEKSGYVRKDGKEQKAA
jgi:hypothetical protein